MSRTRLVLLAILVILLVGLIGIHQRYPLPYFYQVLVYQDAEYSDILRMPSRPVADRQPTTWNDFFAVLKDHYPRSEVIAMPAWMAMAGARLLGPLLSLRRQPSLIAPGNVTGWNLNLAVEPDSLWTELGLEPLLPTIATGIPAALDELVAFRWIHPLEDQVGW